jgi:hypothetical protein
VLLGNPRRRQLCSLEYRLKPEAPGPPQGFQAALDVVSSVSGEDCDIRNRAQCHQIQGIVG